MLLKIRDLIAELNGLVSKTGGKGSHRNFIHPNATEPIDPDPID